MRKKKDFCSRCGLDLGDRARKQRYCKACHAAYMRSTRPKHSQLPDAARKKANARSYANTYLKRGVISRGNCVKCGNTKSQMHHVDYDKPLEVTWLCRPCHLAEHKRLGA